MRLIFSIFLVFSLPIYLPAAATICPAAPAAGESNQREIPLDALFNKVVVQAPGCVAPNGPLCETTKSDLAKLQDDALQASIGYSECAAHGVISAKKPLSVADKTWYKQRAAFWYGLYIDMNQNPVSVSAISLGTYTVSLPVQARFLGLSTTPDPTTNLPAPTTNLPAPGANLPAPTTNLPAPGANLPAPTTNLPAPGANLPAPVAQPPAPPSPAGQGKNPPTVTAPKPKILTIITVGNYTTITGLAQDDKSQTYKSQKIYICLSDKKPKSAESCIASGPATLLIAPPASDKTANTVPITKFVVPDSSSNFTAVIDHALSPGSYVYAVETVDSGDEKGTVSDVSMVSIFRKSAPLGAAAVGLDVTGASSTDPKPVFLATGIMDIPLYSGTDVSKAKFWLTGALRISGMAQPQTLSGQIGSTAAFASYLASGVNSTPDKIVQSLDASVGASWRMAWGSHRAAWELGSSSLDNGNFRDYGFTKPQTLLTLSAIASYGAITPLSNNQSQPIVYNLTDQIYQQYKGQQPGSFTTTSCAGATADTPSFTNCYVSFVPYDRTHFYRNYQAGFRLKLYAGDYGEGQYRFPGVADLTIGQNEYVTGGKFRDPVIHFGGILPVPRVDALYIFGSMDVRASKNRDSNQPQLVLMPPSSSDIKWTDPTVSLVSVEQPNRDRYRIGIGLDLLHLISTLKITTNKDADTAATAK
jgi:hypothetical protein